MHARGIPDAAVDDLVHESFVAMHRRWDGRDPAVPLAAWVVGVARNVAFSYRRAEARRRRRLDEIPPSSPSSSPEESVALLHAWRSLRRFIDGLSPKLREAFVLMELGELPASEVAATLGIPVPTVHSRLRLARREFAGYCQSRGLRDDPAAWAPAVASQRPSRSARRRALSALLGAVAAPAPVALAPGAGGGAGFAKLLAAAAVVGSVGLAAVVLRSPDPPSPLPTGARADPSSPPPSVGAEDRPESPANPGPPSDGAHPNREVRGAAGSTPRPVAPPGGSKTRPSSDGVTRGGDSLSSQSSPTLSDAEPDPGRRGRSDPRESPPDGGAAATIDPLVAGVARLERARTLARSGAFSQALSVLDAGPVLPASLRRDYLRLVLQAACGARDTRRADQVARALNERGWISEPDPPCVPHNLEAK